MADTILVVDDDPDIQTQVRHILADHPYRVLAASDAMEALRLVPEEKPKLVLLDINLGELDGFGVLQKIMAHRDERAWPLQVLMLTSSGSMDDVRRALEQGAADYIIKPVDAAYLLNRVVQYMSAG